MDIFKKLGELINGPKTTGTAVPGAMGDLLAQMGIVELGPVAKGIPPSVAMGNKKGLVLIPGATRPAMTRDGKPLMATNKRGQTYQVQDNYGVTPKQWRMMQNDQKRKAAGRWYSGAQVAA